MTTERTRWVKEFKKSIEQKTGFRILSMAKAEEIAVRNGLIPEAHLDAAAIESGSCAGRAVAGRLCPTENLPSKG